MVARSNALTHRGPVRLSTSARRGEQQLFRYVIATAAARSLSLLASTYLRSHFRNDWYAIVFVCFACEFMILLQDMLTDFHSSQTNSLQPEAAFLSDAGIQRTSVLPCLPSSDRYDDAHQFFGECSFTGFIHRMRGYYSTRDKLSGYEKGELPTSYYYVPMAHKLEMHKYAALHGAFFNREFPTAWRDLDKGIGNHPMIE
jgi:hypothetical protein